MNKPSCTALAVGTRVRFEKGCRALELDKGVTAVVVEIRELGADYSHSARVVLRFVNGFKAGKQVALFTRHVNRLADPVVRMNNGDPTKFIELVRV